MSLSFIVTFSNARVSCSHQERLNLVRSGAVMTSSTSLSTRISDFRTCTRAVVAQRLRDPTKPLCGPVLPAMQTPHVCNQGLRYHAWSRYWLRSTLVLPWIVTVSVLHGVWDVLFPRSCFATRNRFFSLVIWLHDILKITVGYKCTCADDTRTITTTEILYIQTDTHEMSALVQTNYRTNEKFVPDHSF